MLVLVPSSLGEKEGMRGHEILATSNELRGVE